MNPDNENALHRILGGVEQAVVNLNKTNERLSVVIEDHSKRIGKIEQGIAWLLGAAAVAGFVLNAIGQRLGFI